MDIRKRILAPCMGLDGTLDLGSFLQHLLLFETYIISSARLTELPPLVKAFGFEAVVAALNSGALRIDYTAVALGDAGHDQPLHYRLVAIRTTAPEVDLERHLRNALSALPTMTLHRRTSLGNAVHRAKIASPPQMGQAALRVARRDLEENSGLMKRAIAHKFREKLGTEPPRFNARVHLLNAEDTYVETDIQCDEKLKHSIVQGGVFGVCNLNMRIEQMRGFEAITGFRDAEQPYVDDKLAFATAALRDPMQAQQLSRVLVLSGFPDLGTAAANGEVDLERVLAVRASRECAEFREWLRSLDSVPDDDLRDRIASLRARLGGALSSGPGRAIRFLASMFDPSGGVASGAFDEFVVNRVLERPGPIAFLNDQLPSIFKQKE